jgi:hypothetical protein
MRRLALLVSVTGLALVVSTAQACACGVALDATVSRERALVIDHGGREQIVLSLDLQSDTAGRSAIVLPVPADPEVAAIEGGDPLAYLDLATAPVAAAGGGDEGVRAGSAAGGGVDVIGRDEIGGYDVSRLRADDAGALDEWLDENGYTLPDGAEPILRDYVDEGWRYVAVQLAPNSTGTLKPLNVEFETDDLVYPMRLSQLGSDPVDLTVYTLADGRRTIDGLDETYAGPVAELAPPVPTTLKDVFEQGTYVTKLSAIGADPARFTEDLRIGGGSSGGAPGWGPVIAIIAALGGIGLLVLSRTR